MVATVFQGVVNRMINGYLLRDAINKVNEINFGASDQIHTLSHLYETMLAWWDKRKENERAWKVAADEVLKYDDDGNLLSVNLDLKNPSSGDPFEHVPPEKLVAGIVAKERQILALMAEIQEALEGSEQ